MLLVDASQVGAGAVLLQGDAQGVVRPLNFLPKKLNKYQCNYSVIEKKLCNAFGLQHFHIHAGSGGPTLLYTNHSLQNQAEAEAEADVVVIVSSGLQL